MIRTIFAPATAPGRAGIAVIRISGPQASCALKALGCDPLPTPRYATCCALKNIKTNEIIDRSLVLWFPSPHSFTGEDTAELHVHGSRAVVQILLQYLGTLQGLSPAEPGEFSRRALENGKMDVIQAEGLADLIEAETAMQQKQALRQMSGELTAIYDHWREDAITILAEVEAYIDFPDEDIPADIEQEIISRTTELKDKILLHIENDRGKMLREGVHITIVGAPNVGKSSLLNYLARKDVAIVSEIAGTTRDVIEVHLDVDGYPVTISDTAGLRESQDVIETEGVRRAMAQASVTDIKLCMFDAGDEGFWNSQTLELVGENDIVVINKIDACPLPQDTTLKGKMPVLLSLKEHRGTEQLMQVLEERLHAMVGLGTAPAYTRERHQQALRQCAEYLEKFLQSRQEDNDITLGAEELRMAANMLGVVTGKIAIEDLFDHIFSNFCIGK